MTAPYADGVSPLPVTGEVVGHHGPLAGRNHVGGLRDHGRLARRAGGLARRAGRAGRLARRAGALAGRAEGFAGRGRRASGRRGLGERVTHLSLEAGGVAADLTNGPTHGPSGVGKLLGAEDQQSHYQDDEDLDRTNASHRKSLGPAPIPEGRASNGRSQALAGGSNLHQSGTHRPQLAKLPDQAARLLGGSHGDDGHGNEAENCDQGRQQPDHRRTNRVTASLGHCVTASLLTVRSGGLEAPGRGLRGRAMASSSSIQASSRSWK